MVHDYYPVSIIEIPKARLALPFGPLENYLDFPFASNYFWHMPSFAPGRDRGVDLYRLRWDDGDGSTTLAQPGTICDKRC